MNKATTIFFFSVLFFVSSCTKEDSVSPGETMDNNLSPTMADGLFFGSSSGESSSGSSNGGNGQPNQEGLITAGEWNDLDNWDFWNDIIVSDEFSEMPEYWDFYTQNRISVFVKNTVGFPVKNIDVQLLRNQDVVWSSKTDNYGRAELWANLFYNETLSNTEGYKLVINNAATISDFNLFQNGVNEIVMPENPKTQLKAEIAFVVDATGSMSDEVEFLKSDLKDVINRAESDHPEYTILTGAVFYRDETDEYLTKLSAFSDGISTTLDFIDQQNAGGGGDYPEAVHSALDRAVNELNWTDEAATRILFLLLDAPPHYEPQVVSDLHNSIKKAAKKGVKIIPISASGVNKNTEFLMRYFAIATNGTYVFITDHSGIGNDHIEASVGEFEVEFLNDLMVRLLNKYME